ncbi:MAG: hypothetical protein WCV69_00485 [Patescibacteria group bacterium]|jgi:hypothetical protein
MNGDLRPEIKIPPVESASNADFVAGREQAMERAAENIVRVPDPTPVNDQILSAQQAVSVTPVENQQIVLEKVEKILAEDMDNIFLSLDVNQQAEFKKRGEEVSRQITKLLSKGSVSFKKIVNLIVSWLRIIPHVNRFYLEQEAKIKTDKIMRINSKK